MAHDTVRPVYKTMVYGAGEVPGTLAKTVAAILYLYYLTDIIRMEPATAGSICMAGRIWGAYADIRIERLGAGLKTRWGRWRPWFLFSAMPLGGLFALLWTPAPLFTGSTPVYHAFLFFLFMTALSAYYSPYYSFVGEAASRTGHGTGITFWRVLFSFVFGLAAAAVPKIIADSYQVQAMGFTVAGIVSGTVITLSALLIFILTSEYPACRNEPAGTFSCTGFFSMLRNRSFVCLMTVYAGSFAGINILEGFVLYYMKYWIGREGDMPLMLVSVIVSSALTVPIWGILCRKIGKKYTLCAGLVFWAGTQLLWYKMTGGTPFVLVYAAGAIIGIGYGCVHVVPAMMQTDVCDEEEVRTGQRRDKEIAGTISFVTKTGNALSFLVMGLVLQLSGYTPGIGPERLSVIASTMTFGPLAFILIAITASIIYPSTRKSA